MYYLHRIRNICHADLKPQNVLVDDKGTGRVSDFGTSKIVDLPTEGSTGYRPGTALYMPPERLSGGGATKEGDVYAFAITAFRIWTERLPFEESGLTDIALYRTIVDDDNRPTILEYDGMPKELQQLIEGSWDKTPHMRPSFESIAKRLKAMSVASACIVKKERRIERYRSKEMTFEINLINFKRYY
ncbi:kinase-like protein [Gonapodya prolifera JEL478]|uniref:Kinase-like protein n=1 Tax=Gonapodya prolifera (strain JEL478) TaxID=1344416 RepID=A0A138ZYU2_GONPJ|nr:kinase-like protein [Gonapodya prolifera JEL478]|eukprot:KXS09651.1 kinase-like protein [Gonapodya prolifera JEL478]